MTARRDIGGGPRAGATVLTIAGGLAAAALLAAATAAAQESSNRVATKKAWVVFEEASPRECWATSSPVASVNTRGGKPVSVRRSDILLMAFFRPGAGANGQVGFTGGYPFAKGSVAKITVDGKEFELFTQGEWGWPTSTEVDAKIIEAFKRGNDAVVTARSSRGTETKDTFSLIGFTAAFDEARKRCG